jgi:transcriptional regulator with XRE-family HTH domain
MYHMLDKLDERLGRRIKEERETRGWSLADLAERSGVSRAMINKIERGESSPTASLLGRLSGAFQLTLSILLARAEGESGRLARLEDQPQWRDPATGYIRRQVIPARGSTFPLELVEVELPVGASVSFPASSYTFFRQAIWVLKGRLTFIEGDHAHDLRAGDCLELGPPSDCTFRNTSQAACIYAVLIVR